jgi:hypothetical protein
MLVTNYYLILVYIKHTYAANFLEFVSIDKQSSIANLARTKLIVQHIPKTKLITERYSTASQYTANNAHAPPAKSRHHIRQRQRLIASLGSQQAHQQRKLELTVSKSQELKLRLEHTRNAKLANKRSAN